MGYPKLAGWFISWKVRPKWMMTGGTPIGNRNMTTEKWCGMMWDDRWIYSIIIIYNYIYSPFVCHLIWISVPVIAGKSSIPLKMLSFHYGWTWWCGFLRISQSGFGRFSCQTHMMIGDSDVVDDCVYFQIHLWYRAIYFTDTSRSIYDIC